MKLGEAELEFGLRGRDVHVPRVRHHLSLSNTTELVVGHIFVRSARSGRTPAVTLAVVARVAALGQADTQHRGDDGTRDSLPQHARKLSQDGETRPRRIPHCESCCRGLQQRRVRQRQNERRRRERPEVPVPDWARALHLCAPTRAQRRHLMGLRRQQ